MMMDFDAILCIHVHTCYHVLQETDQWSIMEGEM